MVSSVLVLCLVAAASAFPSFSSFHSGYGGYGHVSAECVYSEWTQWSPCSAACETPGFSSRSRVVLYDPSAHYGPPVCDSSALEEWRDCFGEECAHDCVPADWAAWCECSAQCGPGERHRSRGVLSDASNGGAPCDFMEEVEECNNGFCAQDCVQSNWESWTSCSSRCGPGTRDRTRFTISDALNGGFACGPSSEWEQCDNGPCAQDCAYSEWQQWSGCPSCGQASRSRSRQITQEGRFGGFQCDFNGLSETESCPFISCSVDCEMGSWEQWSQCSSDCGSGKRSRYRSIFTQPQNGGRQCGPTEEWEGCDNGPCARNCEYGSWSSWSGCPSCGNAQRSRSRQVVVEGQNGGIRCDFGALAETEECPFQPCSVDCVMGTWEAWSRCSADCEEGQRSRYRSVITYPQNGGRQCESTEEWEGCNNGPCARNCAYESWSQWSRCPSCGNAQAQRSRSRQILVEGQFGGVRCDFGALAETEQCPFVPSCSTDCEMSSWEQWSRCSSDGGRQCGPGRRSRFRSILTYPQNGGRQCEDKEQWESCNNGPCQQNCAYDTWSSWSQCPSCGQAQRSRSRQILVEGKLGGMPCDFGALAETEQCPFVSCSVDCEMSSWEQWSRCSSDGGRQCGPGRRSRFRSILTYPQNGGRQCEDKEQWESCNNGPCQQNCAYDTWSSWSQCPSCGQAQRSRSRQILVEGKFGGVPCDFGDLAESEQCPFVSCSVDCQMSSWSQWSGCSVTCDDGQRSRTRSILQFPSNGGRQCESKEEWEGCNNGECPCLTPGYGHPSPANPPHFSPRPAAPFRQSTPQLSILPPRPAPPPRFPSFSPSQFRAPVPSPRLTYG